MKSPWRARQDGSWARGDAHPGPGADLFWRADGYYRGRPIMVNLWAGPKIATYWCSTYESGKATADRWLAKWGRTARRSRR